MPLEYALFAVDTTPYAFWGYNIKRDNLSCIERIDPKYFEHMADIHGGALETAEKQYAAVALRAAYSQALETLFALMGAALQAPECVVGWLISYKNNELVSLIRKIHNGGDVLNKQGLDSATWRTIAATFLPLATAQEEKERIQEAFANLWGRLAEEFLDEEMSREYNSVKHGLRSHMHGFTLGIGIQEQEGVPAENITWLVASEFGTHYFVSEPLTDGRNRQLARHGRNWDPMNFVSALRLIAISIENMIAFLRFSNHVPQDQIRFRILEDYALEFEKPWEAVPAVESMRWSTSVEPGDIRSMSKAEILAVYQKNTGQP